MPKHSIENFTTDSKSSMFTIIQSILVIVLVIQCSTDATGETLSYRTLMVHKLVHILVQILVHIGTDVYVTSIILSCFLFMTVMIEWHCEECTFTRVSICV